jgi:uncharacterized caspase-like protein
MTSTGAPTEITYYSGHGMQFGGRNYLLPVEARLQASEDVNRFRLLPALDDILDVLQNGKGARVVILDACRNNPVEEDLKRAGRGRSEHEPKYSLSIEVLNESLRRAV